MGRQRNELHLVQVEAWKKKNAGISSNDLTRLQIKAIQAVRLRSLATLSGVTVSAVIDRTLIETKEKFPILSGITIDAEGMHFLKLIEHTPNSQTDELQRALQELLIELLDVFGKITADILTKYLHQELMNVTADTSLGLFKNRENK